MNFQNGTDSPLLKITQMNKKNFEFNRNGIQLIEEVVQNGVSSYYLFQSNRTILILDDKFEVKRQVKEEFLIRSIKYIENNFYIVGKNSFSKTNLDFHLVNQYNESDGSFFRPSFDYEKINSKFYIISLQNSYEPWILVFDKSCLLLDQFRLLDDFHRSIYSSIIAVYRESLYTNDIDTALFIFGSKCINLYQSVSKFCEV